MPFPSQSVRMASFELCGVQPAGGHMKPRHPSLRTRKAHCPVPQRGQGWHYTRCARCFQPTFFITDALKPKHHYPPNKSKLRRSLISYWHPDFTQDEEEQRKLLSELRPGVPMRALFAWCPGSRHSAACWSSFSQALAPLCRCQLFAAPLSDMFVFWIDYRRLLT